MNNKIRIALADDHKLIRAGIMLILNNQDEFEIVLEASNGQELLDGLNDAKPDVVLLDLEMPILSGPETLGQLRTSHPYLPVLILTMHNTDVFILQMMEMGANGYLIKNSEPQEVVDAIKKVVTSKFYFSDRVSEVLLKNVAHQSHSAPSIHAEEEKITQREIEILKLICKEFTTSEIGKILFLSPKTIEGYRKSLMQKTNSKNMAGLVLFAVKNGLVNDI